MAASDQRANLHRTIWRVANDLRGSVDGWDFKAYVLGMLFYRFISEHITNWVNKIQAEGGEADFNYAQISDEQAETAREYMVNTLGFFISPSELFQNVRRAAPRDQNLNETLAAVFADIEASAIGSSSEDDLKGLFDDVNTNSPRLGNSIAERNAKLVKLLDAIADLELGNYQDADIDTFGDAYEYLMTMYASSAGKSGGEFCTPQDVSELIARPTMLGKTRVGRVYDLSIIKMAFGASLGGGVLFELVKDKNLHIQKLFFEGTSFFENAGLISKMLGHVFLSKQKKARQDPQVVISQVAKRYGKYAKLLVDTLVSMDKQSIRNIVYDCGHIRLPRLLEDRQKEVIFSYGDKDPNLGHAKRSIKKHYPKAEIKIWQGYGHCEEMTQNTEAYLTFVKEFLDSDLWNEKDKS